MSPKTRILVASAVLLALGTAASASGLDAALLARLLLGGAALAGFGFWYVKARKAASSTGHDKPRLAVIARTGLSQRTALALVEVDGQALLVVHGDGFAEVHPGSPSKKQPRRRARRSFKAALRSVS
jgi:hypothetical protein